MFPYFSTLALYIRVFFKHESSIVISDDISGFIQINLADLENLVGISTVSRLFP